MWQVNNRNLIATLTCLLLGLGSAATAAADAARDWQEPFDISLPELARTILLKPGADAKSLAEQLGLGQYSVLSRGRQGSMLETRMNEEEWQRLQQTACNGSGFEMSVQACETASCQAIELQGEATPGSEQGAQQVQARLVRNPPELVPLPDPTVPEAGTCSGPPLVPSLEGPVSPRDLRLDLGMLSDLRGSGGDPTMAQPAPAQKGPSVAAAQDADRGTYSGADGAPGGASDAPGSDPGGPLAETGVETGTETGTATGAETSTETGAVTSAETGAEPGAEPGPSPEAVDGVGADAPTTVVADAARRSFAFALNSRFNPLGGVQLGADELPADTSDWSLVVGAGCSEVSVPLSSLAPARAPGLVLALVVSGSAADVASAYNLQVVREISLDTTGETLAVFATADNVLQVIALLALDNRVAAAQPEFVYVTGAALSSPAEAPGSPPGAGAEPAAGHNDPFAWLTYGPEKTGAVGLHGEIKGTGQLVAVIDTGVDVEHPELEGRIREYVDVSERGWSADAHGTAVAGIIAANADNGLGSYGVAPEAQILALKACQPKEGGLTARCWTSTLVKALDVAMARDAGVINMSLAGPPDDLLARYVDLAAQQNRIVVAAAGNGGPNAKPGFPAALPRVLAVTAVDAEDGLYALANVGEYIDVAAPGVDIVTPSPDGGYPPLSGTSMAAAHTSGIAALMRELMPMMSAAEIVAVLRTRAADLGDAGRDARFGAGRIDACAAAEQVSAAAVVCTGLPDTAAAPLAEPPVENADLDTGLDTGVSDELVIELD